MTVHTLGSEARNARILAQRLYGQCRKTASSWRSLSPALRHMRNSLEELEDLILDEALGNASTAHILISIGSCVLALRELDRQLQFYRCSAARWQAAISETVTQVNASLSAATVSLLTACGLENSEVTSVPKTDQADDTRASLHNCQKDRTQTLADSSLLTPSISSPSPDSAISEQDKSNLNSSQTSGILSDAGHVSSSSQEAHIGPTVRTASEEPLHGQLDEYSSASTLRRDVDLPASMQTRVDSIQGAEGVEDKHQHAQLFAVNITDAQALRMGDDALPDLDAADVPLPDSPIAKDQEQEVMVSESIAVNSQHSEKLLLVTSADGTLEKPAFLNWRSPFAEIDPLSVDFEAATSFLLGPPRQSMESPVSADAHEHQEVFVDSLLVNPVETTEQTSVVAITPSKDDGESANQMQTDHEVTDHQLDDEHHSDDGMSQITYQDCLSPRDFTERTHQQELSQSIDLMHVDASALQSGFGEACVGHPIPEEHLTDDIRRLLESPARQKTDREANRHSYEAQSRPQQTLQPAPYDHILATPLSKYASAVNTEDSERCDDIEHPRADSKVDLHFSAPPSPGTSTAKTALASQGPTATSTASLQLTRTPSAREEETMSLNTDTAVVDTGRRSFDSTLNIQEKVTGRPRTSSEPPQPAPSLDILAALRQTMPAPVPPPKGRYHIVNPSPRSRSQSIHDEDMEASSRSVSPVSARTSGEIPMILVQESSESSASILARVVDRTPTSTSASDAARAENDSGAEQLSQRPALRYYSQDFSKLGTMHTEDTSPQEELLMADSSIRQPIVAERYGSSGALVNEEADAIRINSICQSWYRQEWTRAEAYLLGLLEAQQEGERPTMLRRVRHLLGVSASFQGQWQRAVSYFVSALSAPLKEASQMDEGDRAALIWLSDCYVLSNRRLEAFIANALALQSLLGEEHQSGLKKILLIEQKAILSGGSAAQLELKWNQLTTEQISKTKDTIVNHDIVSPNLIEICFNQPMANATPLPKSTSILPRNRATFLCELENYDVSLAEYMEFRVSPGSFSQAARWPMPYDPFFAAEQAAKGRLCDRPCDLLAALRTTPQMKIPKNGPLGSSRFDCFTCGELEWLVKSVRDCLSYLEMKWDEVANSQGIWFTARFAMKHRNVLTANYFAISLFKQSMRQGYGVEVCVDGVRSARVMHDSPEYPQGVHYTCEKRLKKFFKDYLSKAHRLWTKNGKPADSLSAIEVASGELAREASTLVAKGLPLPPKSGLTLHA